MIEKSAFERYEFKPFVGSSHSWALSQLIALPHAASILDIGPGSGEIGAWLHNSGFQDLRAVEIDPDTITYLQQKQIYKEIVTDLSACADQHFDCVLLLDVLEHLPQPFDFLERVVTLLKPGGVIFISVPNIAHWSLRISLLFGFFEYTERGTLDKTHLQFFSRRRFLKLCSHCPDTALIMNHVSIEPAEFVLPAWLWDNAIFRTLRTIQMSCAQLLPGLLGYQHLAIIRKGGR